MRVRISYTARVEQPDPICELDIERHDGVLVASASTRVSGFTLPKIPAGDGWFEWQLDSLTLTPGTYYFTPRILERSGMHAYDEHVHWYRIRVHTGTLRERRGVAILPWGVDGVRLKRQRAAPDSPRVVRFSRGHAGAACSYASPSCTTLWPSRAHLAVRHPPQLDARRTSRWRRRRKRGEVDDGRARGRHPVPSGQARFARLAGRHPADAWARVGSFVSTTFLWLGSLTLGSSRDPRTRGRSRLRADGYDDRDVRATCHRLARRGNRRGNRHASLPVPPQHGERRADLHADVDVHPADLGVLVARATTDSPCAHASPALSYMPAMWLTPYYALHGFVVSVACLAVFVAVRSLAGCAVPGAPAPGAARRGSMDRLQPRSTYHRRAHGVQGSSSAPDPGRLRPAAHPLMYVVPGRRAA